MFNAYTKTNSIIFDDGIYSVDYPYQVTLDDYEDYFTIETEIEIDRVARGWLGDITFILSGCEISPDCFPEENVSTEVTYKDALCVRRTFELSSDRVALWKYTFNRY